MKPRRSHRARRREQEKELEWGELSLLLRVLRGLRGENLFLNNYSWFVWISEIVGDAGRCAFRSRTNK